MFDFGILKEATLSIAIEGIPINYRDGLCKP